MTNEERIVLAIAVLGLFVLEPFVGFRQASIFAVPLVVGVLLRGVISRPEKPIYTLLGLNQAARKHARKQDRNPE